MSSLSVVPRQSNSVIRKSPESFVEDHIPTEIWGIIFHLCIPSDQFTCPDSIQAPLLLTYVCSTWRNIALALPQLWASASFDLGIRHYSYSDMAARWLQRSVELPLIIEMRFPDTQQTRTWGYNNRSLTNILASSSRWRVACVRARETEFDRVQSHYMPLLETLQLQILDPPAGRMYLENATALPRLHEFSCFNPAMDPRLHSLPWDQLTHFYSHYPLLHSDAIELIHRCPRLVSCTLQLGPYPRGVIPGPPPFMSRLRTLTLRVALMSRVGSVLAALIVPHLREFELVAVEGVHRAKWEHSAVQALLVRSGCALQRLCIADLKLQEKNLVALVRGNPSLKAVHVIFRGLPQSLSLLAEALRDNAE